MIAYIIEHTQLKENAVKNTVDLLNEDCTIPFISRYRKEKTGHLNEVDIANIVKYKELYEALSKRKKAILKALAEQNILDNTLENRINNTNNVTALEDLYLPYKKSKKTKAEKARLNGLEPLAKIIMAQNANNIDLIAIKYINKNIETAEQALEGAQHIIAEWINERTDIRNNIRRQLKREAMISTKVVKTKKEEASAQKFRDYFEWEERLNRIPSHRMLAILRAENEGYIRVKISIDDQRALNQIEDRIIKSNNSCSDCLVTATKDAYKRLLLPALTNEILQIVKDEAHDTAIAVFAKNLKQLLLGAPLGQKKVLAIDPGFKSGCKIVCLDNQGQLEHYETLYPHPPKSDSSGTINRIKDLCVKHKIEALAIGNGTASRETEAIIKKIDFKNDIQIFIVSEAGASIYSASKIAREEFPNHDVTVRGAVSIGRRLQDPLAELVKIDAKSIGVGQYQHDVDQNKLQKQLDTVVENCVNAVGVNINTASKSLLSYVSGIGPKLAENIFNYKKENGNFKSRKDIKKVPRLGNKAFEQGAAFLRIKNAEHPLDDSAVHPERYTLVTKIAKDIREPLTNIIGNTELIKKIKLESYCTTNVGLPTLKDIVKELDKPGLDIRTEAKAFAFNSEIKTIKDVHEGQELPGIVNNITNFGCFVDIGVKESGLIHISNLSDSFVKDVNNHVSLHQHVLVKVLEVDLARKRIQLKLIK